MKKYKFVQHVPTFAEGCIPKTFTFTSQEDLILKLSGIGYGNGVGEYFELSGNLIMEVSDSGYHWWVAGKVSSTECLNFNKWEARERPKLTKEEIQGRKDSGELFYDPNKIVISVGGIVLEGFTDDVVTINSINEEGQ